MLPGIEGLYLLAARSLAPNLYRIHGMGINAAEMKPKVEYVQPPVKLVITIIIFVKLSWQKALSG